MGICVPEAVQVLMMESYALAYLGIGEVLSGREETEKHRHTLESPECTNWLDSTKGH